jgi:hypothetical protein
MTKYFEGIRTHGPYVFGLDGRQVKYSLYERWINTGIGQTIRCGIPGNMKITRQVGFEKKQITGFKDFIEGSIGIDKIASIKARLEDSASVEISETAQQIIEREFPLPAPECGSQTTIAYQLIKNHEFVITKPRRFRKPAVHSFTLREETQNFDLSVWRDKDDPQCPCDNAEEKRDNEIISIRLGNLNIRIDARKDDTSKMLQFELGSKSFEFAFGAIPFEAKINLSEFPEFISFLAGIEGVQANAQFSGDQESVILLLEDTISDSSSSRVQQTN